MPCITELMSFPVKLGEEERAAQWLQTLVERRAECIDASLPPLTHQPVVSFIPATVAHANAVREQGLAKPAD